MKPRDEERSPRRPPDQSTLGLHQMIRHRTSADDDYIQHSLSHEIGTVIRRSTGAEMDMSDPNHLVLQLRTIPNDDSTSIQSTSRFQEGLNVVAQSFQDSLLDQGDSAYTINATTGLLVSERFALRRQENESNGVDEPRETSPITQINLNGSLQHQQRNTDDDTYMAMWNNTESRSSDYFMATTRQNQADPGHSREADMSSLAIRQPDSRDVKSTCPTLHSGYDMDGKDVVFGDFDNILMPEVSRELDMTSEMERGGNGLNVRMHLKGDVDLSSARNEMGDIFMEALVNDGNECGMIDANRGFEMDGTRQIGGEISCVSFQNEKECHEEGILHNRNDVKRFSNALRTLEVETHATSDDRLKERRRKGEEEYRLKMDAIKEERRRKDAEFLALLERGRTEVNGKFGGFEEILRETRKDSELMKRDDGTERRAKGFTNTPHLETARIAEWVAWEKEQERLKRERDERLVKIDEEEKRKRLASNREAAVVRAAAEARVRAIENERRRFVMGRELEKESGVILELETQKVLQTVKDTFSAKELEKQKELKRVTQLDNEMKAFLANEKEKELRATRARALAEEIMADSLQRQEVFRRQNEYSRQLQLQQQLRADREAADALQRTLSTGNAENVPPLGDVQNWPLLRVDGDCGSQPSTQGSQLVTGSSAGSLPPALGSAPSASSSSSSLVIAAPSQVRRSGTSRTSATGESSATQFRQNASAGSLSQKARTAISELKVRNVVRDNSSGSNTQRPSALQQRPRAQGGEVLRRRNEYSRQLQLQQQLRADREAADLQRTLSTGNAENVSPLGDVQNWPLLRVDGDGGSQPSAQSSQLVTGSSSGSLPPALGSAPSTSSSSSSLVNAAPSRVRRGGTSRTATTGDSSATQFRQNASAGSLSQKARTAFSELNVGNVVRDNSNGSNTQRHNALQQRPQAQGGALARTAGSINQASSTVGNRPSTRVPFAVLNIDRGGIIGVDGQLQGQTSRNSAVPTQQQLSRRTGAGRSNGYHQIASAQPRQISRQGAGGQSTNSAQPVQRPTIQASVGVRTTVSTRQIGSNSSQASARAPFAGLNVGNGGVRDNAIAQNVAQTNRRVQTQGISTSSGSLQQRHQPVGPSAFSSSQIAAGDVPTQRQPLDATQAGTNDLSVGTSSTSNSANPTLKRRRVPDPAPSGLPRPTKKSRIAENEIRTVQEQPVLPPTIWNQQSGSMIPVLASRKRQREAVNDENSTEPNKVRRVLESNGSVKENGSTEKEKEKTGDGDESESGEAGDDGKKEPSKGGDDGGG
ncbi:hypothetical protein BC829DRAFT_489914 [Chytridium lagenaria]|nr:hypothetical protein BC829DRAFT_489914 [Chytridium lagenaria]